MVSPWLIYALGGGWGHLTRALALGRIAARRYPVKILTNSSYAAYVKAREVQVQAIAPTATLRSTCEQVWQVLGQDYGCLIVDTFPRGLGGELVDILPQKPRILIHRDLHPSYVRTKHLSDFVARHFQQVIVPGEGAHLPLAALPQVRYTAPWLLRSADELPSYEVARSILSLNGDPRIKTVVVLASGQFSELVWYGDLTWAIAQQLPEVAVRCLAATCPPGCPLHLWTFHWPAMECLRAADVVVGGAGYNTFYECQVLGIPLVAVPFQRLYDRQHSRVHHWLSRSSSQEWTVTAAEDSQSAIAAVRQLLDLGTCWATQGVPRFVNGALSAAQQIEQAIAPD